MQSDDIVLQRKDISPNLWVLDVLGDQREAGFTKLACRAGGSHRLKVIIGTVDRMLRDWEMSRHKGQEKRKRERAQDKHGSCVCGMRLSRCFGLCAPMAQLTDGLRPARLPSSSSPNPPFLTSPFETHARSLPLLAQPPSDQFRRWFFKRPVSVFCLACSSQPPSPVEP